MSGNPAIRHCFPSPGASADLRRALAAVLPEGPPGLAAAGFSEGSPRPQTSVRHDQRQRQLGTARTEGRPTGQGPASEVPPESHSSPLFGYKGLTLKAAADSGVSLLARGRVTVRRDTEAPMSPGVAASGDRAAEGLLPRARPLRPRDGPRPRAIGSLRLLLPGAGMHRVSHRLAFRAP